MPLDLFKITKIDLRDYFKERAGKSLVVDIQPILYQGILPKRDLHKAIQFFSNKIPEEAEEVVEYSCFEDLDVKKYLNYSHSEDLSHLVYIQMFGLAIITQDSLIKKNFSYRAYH